jgi:hypothetical protein
MQCTSEGIAVSIRIRGAPLFSWDTKFYGFESCIREIIMALFSAMEQFRVKTRTLKAKACGTSRLYATRAG